MIINIQVLRAIAAIMVIAFHTVLAAQEYNLATNFFYKVDIWGAAGVDIFFIISGFIMIHIQNKKHRGPLGFLKDRVERIVPLYWLLTIFLALLAVVVPQIFNSLTVNSETLIQSLFFSNFLFNEIPLLYVGWTLEYEMLFYLVFGLSLFIKNQKLSIIVCVATLIAMMFYGLSTMIVEFIYGMIIGILFNKYKLLINNLYCLIMIVLGFSFLTIGWDKGISRSITWGLPSILIFLGFLYLKPIKSKILALLGSASYSMYLIQMFTIPAFYKIISSISVLKVPQLADVYVLLCIACSVIAGLFVYLLIEKPLSNLIYRFKNKKMKVNQQISEV